MRGDGADSCWPSRLPRGQTVCVRAHCGGWLRITRLRSARVSVCVLLWDAVVWSVGVHAAAWRGDVGVCAPQPSQFWNRWEESPVRHVLGIPDESLLSVFNLLTVNTSGLLAPNDALQFVNPPAGMPGC